MSGGHKEIDFEAAIERHMLEKGGWVKGDPKNYDRELALDPSHLFRFIEATQPDLWTEFRKHHKAGLESAMLEALVKHLESRDTLHVLRHGFKFYGKTVRVAYFRPAHGLNPEIIAQYQQNRLVLTRQVQYIAGKPDDIDTVLFLNGLPVATVELKNHFTGQTVQHGIRQYKDRDPKHKLLAFKTRALVHFAVDTEQVYMTTKLAKANTFFLPFNRGHEGGAGNPPHPSGYRTAYLWEQVWQRDSFLDILGRFAHLLVEEETDPDGRKVTKETLIFPRYHQLDVVRKLEASAREHGPGRNYLVQHSAGSGKSNSIAWLAHRLQSLHDENDEKVFSSVVVVTDRKVLDKQLQDTIYQFEHKQGVVQRIDDDSNQLVAALEKGVPIIISTLQKYPIVAERIGKLPDRRYAVIVDEAHSSQSGTAAEKMKQVLAAKDLADAAAQEEGLEEETYEDKIRDVMAARGPQKNLSFFAFTATPKHKTLEVFGEPGPDGKPRPFHLYSMRQAIEEGFILDVLAHYTTYARYFKLVKAVEDDPQLDKKSAMKALARYMSLHPFEVAQKTEIIVEHFRHSVRHRIGGKAKAMVVTRSRLHAVRYKRAVDKYLAEKKYDDIRALVAFSGTVHDPDDQADYTEPSMNRDVKTGKPIGEKELPKKFASGDYQLLLVANKYQTGFDQPLLHTMYVDKRLAGVQAVQTLSRLNRIHAGKTDTFVLDFVNRADEIQAAFQPFYGQTMVEEVADHHQLYDLMYKLDDAQVYTAEEVEAFAQVFFDPKYSATTHARMNLNVSPALERFNALDEAKRFEFGNRLRAFVRLYAFMSHVMPFTDVDLEKLYTFGRFLLTKLPRPGEGEALHLDDEVQLRYYRIEKLSEGSIGLLAGQGGTVRGPAEVGTVTARDQRAALSEIVDTLNDRFGTTFTRSDQLFFDQVKEEAKLDDDVIQQALANDLENFAVSSSLRKRIMDLMVERNDQNTAIVAKYMDDDEFQRLAFRLLVKQIHDEVREEG